MNLENNIVEDIVVGDPVQTCIQCHRQHICKRCTKNMHICSFCGKIVHECDICGTTSETMSVIKKHQLESKFCRKVRAFTLPRMKSSLTLEEYLIRFNIIVKNNNSKGALGTQQASQVSQTRRKSIC